MDPSKFLIIGANGQLGLALRAKYPQAQAVDSGELNITDREAVLGFDWTNTKVIINAAAYTNVDGAETPEGRVTAWQVNAVGPANLAKAAIQNDLRLVHVSSDYVFDGASTNHGEAEPFSPLSVYGQSKAAGDIAVSLVPQHYILRTTWVIGDGKNFVRTMLSLGQRGIAPTVVADQIGRLTFTDELAAAIDHLLQNAPAGTYNVTNGGQPASWAYITRRIFQSTGYNVTVTDTSSARYYADKPGMAPRPLNSVLDLSKLQATGYSARDWQQMLQVYLAGNTKS